MAKDNTAVRLGIYGLVGWTMYNMAMNGSLGTAAKKAAQDLSKAWTGSGGWHLGSSTPSSGTESGGQQQIPSTTPKTLPVPTAPQSGYVSMAGVYDIGDPNQPQPSFPIVYDTALGTVRQDPRQGGTNIYRPGDVFFVNGAPATYLGGTKFSDNSSARTLTI